MKDEKDEAVAAKADTPVSETPKVEVAAAPKRPAFRLKLKPPVLGAILGALCVGAFGGGATVALFGKSARAERPVLTRAEWKALTARVETGAADGAGLATDLKLLRDRIAEGREAADKGRTEASARLSQISERLDRLQRHDADLSAKLAGVGERLDHLDREQSARLSALNDRLEKKPAPTPVAAVAPAALPAPVAAATPTPAAKPAQVASADPALTGSLPDRRQPATVDGWILRDVYDGVAMIENRNRRLIEVGPGDTLPGAGRVEAIERRGKSWVVVTSKGLITSQTW